MKVFIRRAAVVLLASMTFMHSQLCWAAAAKKPKKQESQKTETSAAPRYDESPFVPTIVKLPPGYMGHNPKMIFEHLEKRGMIKKDEFESTSDFQKRMSSLKLTPVYGKCTENAIYAFASRSLDIKYDADTSKLTVALKAERSYITYDEAARFTENLKVREKYAAKEAFNSRYSFLKLDGNTTSRNYSGTNGFGASIEVSEMVVHEDGLTFSMPDFSSNLPVTIICSPDKAKKLKESLYVLVLAQLEEPFYAKGFEGRNATFDNPSSFYVVQNYIHVRVVGLLFYDMKTGEIYGRLPGGTETKD